MGLYNTYGETQLKAAAAQGKDLSLEVFNIGDKVDLKDGVYLGGTGAVVVIDGILVGEFKEVITSWGHKLKPKEIIDKYNPLTHAMEIAKKMQKSKK